MPTYDYRCLACKHEFEHYQSMKDKPLKKCPSCGKASLERLIGTGAAVIFKGSGFYQTDYRSEGYRKSAEADKPVTADAAAKPEPKTDGKSEGKPEAKSDNTLQSKPATTPSHESTPSPKVEGNAKSKIPATDQSASKSAAKVPSKSNPVAKSKSAPRK